MWYNTPINIEIIKFLQSFSNPFLDRLFQGITMLGEEYFFILAMAVVYWCVNKDFGYKIGFICLSSNLVNTSIKDTLKVPRPFFEDGIRSLRIETATGYSFPSGHTQGVASFWIALMLKVKNKIAYIIGTVVIFLVALSRVYLGVHRPIDVTAAIVIGTLWACLCNVLINYAERAGNRYFLLVMVLPFLLGMIYFRTGEFYKTAGTLTGLFVGYVIEPKYINFSVRGTLLAQFIKIIGGLAVVLAIKSLLKQVLPEGIFSDYFRYLIIAVWVTIIMPIIIKKLVKNSN